MSQDNTAAQVQARWVTGLLIRAARIGFAEFSSDIAALQKSVMPAVWKSREADDIIVISESDKRQLDTLAVEIGVMGKDLGPQHEQHNDRTAKHAKRYEELCRQGKMFDSLEAYVGAMEGAILEPPEPGSFS